LQLLLSAIFSWGLSGFGGKYGGRRNELTDSAKQTGFSPILKNDKRKFWAKALLSLIIILSTT